MTTFSSLHALSLLLSDYAEELFRAGSGSTETRLRLVQVYEMQAHVTSRLHAWLVHGLDPAAASPEDASVEQILRDIRQNIAALKTRGPGHAGAVTRGGHNLFNDFESALSILGPPEHFPDDDPAPAPGPSRTRGGR